MLLSQPLSSRCFKYIAEIKGVNSGIRLPRFEFQLLHLSALWSWVSYLASLCHLILICARGREGVSPPWAVVTIKEAAALEFNTVLECACVFNKNAAWILFIHWVFHWPATLSLVIISVGLRIFAPFDFISKFCHRIVVACYFLLPSESNTLIIFFKDTFKNWSIIHLQYFIIFRCTA